MLVVISDLHFEEVASDAILSDGKAPEVQFRRNLGAEAFRGCIARIAQLALQGAAERLDVVLAGDVFDLHRTVLWFGGGDKPPRRPYVSCDRVDATLEERIVEILSAISSDPAVAASLGLLQLLSAGRYQLRAEGSRFEERSFGIPVQLHYLPGNHDRLANATPRTRELVRKLLGGLPGDGSRFCNSIAFDDPRVLVRHGHEYDRYNFSADLRGKPVPPELPAPLYDDWAFGDLVTVDIAMKLPHLFRRLKTDARILHDPILRTIYLRLLEFDDVRPQSRLVDFLLSMPGHARPEIWHELEPVVKAVLDELAANPQLGEALDKARASPFWKLGAASRIWKLGLPLGLLRLVAAQAGGEDDHEAEAVGRETVLESGNGEERKRKRFVIAGHTHHPQVVPLKPDPDPQIFVDTGTWRNTLLASNDGTGFCRNKSQTFVVVYRSDEDSVGAPKSESFDYWSGETQRWS